MANDELMRLAERVENLAWVPGHKHKHDAVVADLRALAQRAPLHGAVPEGWHHRIVATERGFQYDDGLRVHTPTLLVKFRSVDAEKGDVNAPGWRDRDALAAMLAAAPAPEAERAQGERPPLSERLYRGPAHPLGYRERMAEPVSVAEPTAGQPEGERADDETVSGVIVDRDDRGLIEKVYVVKGGRKELHATNPEYVVDNRTPTDCLRDAERYRELRKEYVDSYLANGKLEILDAALDSLIAQRADTHNKQEQP